MASLMELEPIVLVLIGVGSISIVMGFILFGKLNSSSKNTEKKSLLDEDYFENFKTSFESTKSIEGTLEQLEEIYAGENVMQARIQKALTFIQEDYGDYESALEMINIEGNEGVRNLHKKAISAVLNKNEALHVESQPAIPLIDETERETDEFPARTYSETENLNFENTPAAPEEEYSEDDYDLGEGYAAFLADEEAEN